MKPNRKLIDAFRSVATKLTIEEYQWNWGDFEQCNCGLLAQELGIDFSSSVYEELVFFANSWAELGNKWRDLVEKESVCTTTNNPISYVISTLVENGIEYDNNDLDYIENSIDECDTVVDLINFFNKTAYELETQYLSQTVTENKPVQVQVK